MSMAGPARVLFVEDEEYRNEKLIRFLKANGLDVTMAGTLAIAVEEVAKGGYGCVLLDIMLPLGEGENNVHDALTAGVEFLRRLRGGVVAGADVQLPVIVLTGRPEAAVEEEVQALGVDAFLNKPESMKVVLRTIQGAIERG
jgi:DNA-binding response OmpR family regulator